ncbi:MAG TPA: FAD:protein FMN transferase [Actinocrinis sp.]
MRTAVEHVMGTAVSVAAPDTADPHAFDAGCAAAFAVLHAADELFSPFKPDSPVSRLRDGRLAFEDIGRQLPADQAALLRDVLALCAELRTASDGAFDAFAVGDPPDFDPSGAVKGWAAERAGAALTAAGIPAHLVNAGGDVRARGSRDGTGAPWRVGIADPHRPGNTLAVFEVNDGAVATSGTAERGAHVRDPRTGEPATALASVTVAGPRLELADGYATAALAMGGAHQAAQARGWLARLAAEHGYEALTVDAQQGVWWTEGARRYAPALPAL